MMISLQIHYPAAVPFTRQQVGSIAARRPEAVALIGFVLNDLRPRQLATYIEAQRAS